MSTENESRSVYTIKDTKDRGKAVYACRFIPSGTTVHISSEPFVSVIKEKFWREACAWCFKYKHGTKCMVKHPKNKAMVSFCSSECLKWWSYRDYDGKFAEVLASMRTNSARKQILVVDEFPSDLARLVASAIVQQSRGKKKFLDAATWEDVLKLLVCDDRDLVCELNQIIPFLKRNLPPEFGSLVESTAYPFLSRHLINSFGVWELPITPDSENLGWAMYPSASYFNHSCDPNIAKIRQGRVILFATSRDVQLGEELCISYGHMEKNVIERRQELEDGWGFNCNCSRCIHELESFLDIEIDR